MVDGGEMGNAGIRKRIGVKTTTKGIHLLGRASETPVMESVG